MSKLILIDGYAILHRAYHALPATLTNRRGQMVNAIYGFVSMLLKLIVDLKPTHIVVAFDREEKTFRRGLHEGYQAKRKPIDFGLSQQFVMARNLVKAFNIPSYELAGYESDDIIGTISKKVKGEVIIVTGDRDLFQLVNDKVKVYMPSKGISEGKMYKKNDVIEKMGVTPSQIIDYKALVGDASDNYPGVSGIGPKTAINLIGKYGSLESIYKHIDELAEKTSEKLKEGRQSAELSYELARIVTNCPIDFKEDIASKWDIDSKEVLDLFGKFGFRTLTERVKKVGGQLDKEKQMNLI